MEISVSNFPFWVFVCLFVCLLISLLFAPLLSLSRGAVKLNHHHCLFFINAFSLPWKSAKSHQINKTLANGEPLDRWKRSNDNSLGMGLWKCPGLDARFPARRREERGCGPVTGKDRASCQSGGHSAFFTVQLSHHT